MPQVKVLLTDEKIDFLAKLYQKIKTNKVFKKKWKTFEAYVNDYITREEKNEERN